jgi:hypothetical protein
MTFVRAQIKWIMLVSGALTCTMLFALVAPRAVLLATFGETLDGQVAEIVVRNWGALIGLVGAMLIHGALVPRSRSLILVVASVSKVIFIGLVLAYGQGYLARAGVAVVGDSVMVVLYVLYLLGAARGQASA